MSASSVKKYAAVFESNCTEIVPIKWTYVDENKTVSATSRHVLSKVQFKSLCGCYSQVYINWRALTIHLNEVSSHKHMPAPSFSMTTSSFQTITASTPLPASVFSPSSLFLILPPSLSSSHPNLQPPFSSAVPLMLGTPVTTQPSVLTSPLLPFSQTQLFFMSPPPLDIRLLQTTTQYDEDYM